MHTKLKLSHDEMVVLAAIADQELMFSEIKEEIGESCQEVFGGSNLNGMVLLQGLIDKGHVLRTSPFRSSLFRPYPHYYYKIAPETLSLNHPPYSYESWRNLSE